MHIAPFVVLTYISIMLRYMDQIKTFNDNLSCCEVKIDKIFGDDLPYFALKCDKFLAHLSQKLKWAIVIAHRPSSVHPSSGVRL